MLEFRPARFVVLVPRREKVACPRCEAGVTIADDKLAPRCRPGPALLPNLLCGNRQDSLPIALGRRNWLFAGSDKGRVRAAIAFTILGSCRMHGKDPAAYLTDVLRKLGDGWPEARIDELLPDRWQPEPAPA